MNDLTLLSGKKLKNLLTTMSETALTATVAEVGVYKGGSLIEMAKLTTQPVLGFDTFVGLPKEFDGHDEKHRPGEFVSTYEDVKIETMVYPNIVLVRGLFPQTGFERFPDERYSFVHLDMDQWRGTLEALDYFLPRMTKGGVIFFDDYGWHKTPGIKPAVDKWAEQNKLKLTAFDSFQAYVKVNT